MSTSQKSRNRIDQISLCPSLEVSRRLFLTGAGVSVGYAMAAGPVNAEAIQTDMFGITGGLTQIKAQDGTLFNAYVALPTVRPGPHPLVLVVHEIFALHEYIRDVCRRLAKLGYMAVAPDLYARQGDPAAKADINAVLNDIVLNVTDEQVISDLDDTLAWAASHGGDGNRAGITGFCWGGRVVWMYAAHSDKIKAGVAWYGRLTESSGAPALTNPIDVAGQLKAPVLGLYGGADTSIPLSGIDQMKAALRGSKVAYEFKIFPDAPHGFHADYRSSYRPDAAQEGWAKALEWFAKYRVSRL